MRKISLTLILLLYSTSLFAENPDKELEQKQKRAIDSSTTNYAKLESEVVKPKRHPTYQLPAEQMQRLREIEGVTPGQIIPMQPIDKKQGSSTRTSKSSFSTLLSKPNRSTTKHP